MLPAAEGGASAGSGKSTNGRGKRKMRCIRNGPDGERAVVTGDPDAGGGDELADRKSVRGACLNRCGR